MPIQSYDLGQSILGYEQEKRELFGLIELLKNPHVLKEKKIPRPKGIIFNGPSGCGKSLFIDIMLRALEVPVYSIQFGESPEAMMTLLSQSYKNASAHPEGSVVLIENLEELMAESMLPFNTPNSTFFTTLTQCIDAHKDSNIFTIISTRELAPKEELSFMRSGRLDLTLDLKVPIATDRQAILEHHLASLPYTHEDLKYVIDRTSGSSCADLISLAAKAHMLALQDKSETLTSKHLNEALHRVTFKTISRSFHGDEETRKRIAIHEMGHALTAYLINPKMLNSVTLETLGESLGHMNASLGENQVISRNAFYDMMTITAAGYVAENIFCSSNPSTLASQDLESLYQMASQAVKNYGFKSLSSLHYESKFSEGHISVTKLERIEKNIHSLIKDSHTKAFQLLIEKRDDFESLCDLLLDRQTLYRRDFDECCNK